MLRRVGFSEAFKLFWKNYVNFTGRSTRSEYWFAALWMLILYAPLIFATILGSIFLIGGVATESDGVAVMGMILFIICMLVYGLFALAIFIPTWAIMIRRFHDTGRTMTMPIVMCVLTIVMNLLNLVINMDESTELTLSSILFALLSLAYLGLWIYTIVILCLPSQDKDNKYGRSPYVHRYEQGNAPASNVASSKSAIATKGSSGSSSHGSSSDY
ncbi:DUF805 domain-containing protein [Staphylococcus simulans]